MTDISAIATVEDHHPGAYGFTIKTAATGCVYRVLPVRDPAQPRFWCVVVARCTPGGLLDSTEAGWVGRRGLRREDLPDTMGAIRADLSGWLADPAQTALRDWICPPAS
ncbi:MAG: hypothetical protein KC442_14345 [Thermomicrobiales bacterium]|nr:hypothetical protein [Thermomicrobiales bacterium]